MNTKMQMRTLCLEEGTEACDARCPFCVSRLTPTHDLGMREKGINGLALNEVCRQAFEGKVNTVMITGKGEPTLFPEQLSWYLAHLRRLENQHGYIVPKVELQSNGVKIATKPEVYDPLLAQWSIDGLDLADISIVSFDEAKNRSVYTPYQRRYISLKELVDRLHQHDIKSRLACIMMAGYTDSPSSVARLIEFAHEINADELTLRPVNRPYTTDNVQVSEYIDKHLLSASQKESISDYLHRVGNVVNNYFYGATIFDVSGQNVCLTNSLTEDKDGNELRQLIYYPDGQIATSWTS